MITPRRIAVAAVSLLARCSGLNAALRLRRHRQKDFRVYILEYHDVSGEREAEGTVHTERFRRHLRFLSSRFRTCTVAEAAGRLAAAARNGRSLEEDLLVLTFDDGYLDNYRSAWPVLREAGTSATVYLTTGFLDGQPLWFDLGRRAFDALRLRDEPLPPRTRARLLEALGSEPEPGTEIERLKRVSPETRESIVESLLELDLELAPAARPMAWDQVREMSASGIEMGAHTVSHPILSTLSDEAQDEEIRASRRRIQEEVGIEPATFAMPNGGAGDWNEATLRLLERARFLAACTTLRGSNRPGVRLHRLYRLGIGSDSNTVLAARLSGLFDEGLRRALGKPGNTESPGDPTSNSPSVPFPRERS